MNKTPEELEQQVVALQAQLDAAKIYEIDLVNRLATSVREKNELSLKLQTRDITLEESLRRQITVEVKEELRLSNDRLGQTLAGRMKTIIDQKVAEQLEPAVIEERNLLKQQQDQLKEQQDQLDIASATLDQSITDFASEKLVLIRSHAVEVLTLTEKLNQAVRKNEQNDAKIEELTKQLDQAASTIDEQRAVVTFAKTAEQDLTNRLRNLATNTNLRIEAAKKENERAIKATEKVLEDTRLELKTLKYRFQQVSKH